MKNTIYNDIQSLFKSGEIQTIKFAKNGKVMVKFRTEPRAVTFSKHDDVMNVIIEESKLRESLQPVKIVKPKVLITLEELNKLNVIAHEVEFNPVRYKADKNFTKITKIGLFERFYDRMSNFIGGDKSFAPNELKTFA